MHGNASNVLGRSGTDPQSFGPSPHLFGRVSNRDYRAAVAQIIRELKAEKRLTNESLAEQLGCSDTTIYNAENESGNLDPVTMLNLGSLFGGESRLARILALINGCPAEPKTPRERFDEAIAVAQAAFRDAEA